MLTAARLVIVKFMTVQCHNFPANATAIFSRGLFLDVFSVFVCAARGAKGSSRRFISVEWDDIEKAHLTCEPFPFCLHVAKMEVEGKTLHGVDDNVDGRDINCNPDVFNLFKDY